MKWNQIEMKKNHWNLFLGQIIRNFKANEMTCVDAIKRKKN